MAESTDRPFDEFANDYDAALNQGLSTTGESKDFFASGRVNWLADRLRKIGHAPAKILDYGCGTGTSISLLAALPGAVEVVGVDVSEASLKTAAANLSGMNNVRFATPAQLPPTAQMDLAFCNGVFHHIPLDQRDAAMKYIFDSLRSGGIFAFWENNPWNPGTRYVMSRIPFDRDAITLSPPTARRLARASGLQVLMTRFLFYFPKSLSWLRWIEPALSTTPLGGQYIVLCRKP